MKLIKPICERGRKCVYLIKEIKEYSYPLYAKSQVIVTGKELCYFCNNPQKFDSYRLPKKLTHAEKFKMCEHKVTNQLDEFVKV